jgi:hypothetical protein
VYHDPSAIKVACTNFIVRIATLFILDELVTIQSQVKEHVFSFKNNDSKSAFAKHVDFRIYSGSYNNIQNSTVLVLVLINAHRLSASVACYTA